MAMYINSYRPWPAWVVRGNEEIAAKFNAEIGTYRGHANGDPGHDMSGNLAADFFLYDNSAAQHDRVLAWFKQNAERIGATYIITRRRIWSVARASEGNRTYYGSDPHTGHIHVSYGTVAPASSSSSGGVPLMATAQKVQVGTYSGNQSLEAGTGLVHINADKHTTIVNDSPGIDLTATIVIDGLADGETVDVWWSREWKKTGASDKIISQEIPTTIRFNEAVQYRYATSLAKADTGWTACLRLRYKTTSKTAKIAKLHVRGWELV